MTDKYTIQFQAFHWGNDLEIRVQARLDARFIVFMPFYHMSPVKRICVFEHSVMTRFNCACLAIQRGQGSGFLSEGSSWHCLYERATEVLARLRLAWNFAARIGDK